MAPLVLGLVVGSLFEKALVQTPAIGDGDLTILFTRPISLTVLLLAGLFVFAPTLVARLRGGRRRGGSGGHGSGPAGTSDQPVGPSDPAHDNEETPCLTNCSSNTTAPCFASPSTGPSNATR